MMPLNGLSGTRASGPLLSLTMPYHLPPISRIGQKVKTLANSSGCAASAPGCGPLFSGNSPGSAPLPWRFVITQYWELGCIVLDHTLIHAPTFSAPEVI